MAVDTTRYDRTLQEKKNKKALILKGVKEGQGSVRILFYVLGMLVGLCIALFISYRKPRIYQNITPQESNTTQATPEVSPFKVVCSLVAIVAALVIQLESDSMIMGALAGFLIFTLSGVVRPSEADDLFTRGMRMMAQIGFIMIAAASFAAVMKATGHIDTLVADSVNIIGNPMLNFK